MSLCLLRCRQNYTRIFFQNIVKESNCFKNFSDVTYPVGSTLRTPWTSSKDAN
jgi:hypothetical protein